MYEETHGECGDFGEHTKNSFGQRLGTDLRLNKHKNAVAKKSTRTGDEMTDSSMWLESRLKLQPSNIRDC